MEVHQLHHLAAGWTLHAHETSGNQHAMPCHDAFRRGAGIVEDRKGWVFRAGRRIPNQITRNLPTLDRETLGDG
jgi:hypothetical protein